MKRYIFKKNNSISFLNNNYNLNYVFFFVAVACVDG